MTYTRIKYYSLNVSAVRTIFVAVLLFIITLSSICQISNQAGEDLVKLAMKNFKPPSNKPFWVKDMRGYFDGRHEIRMVLVTDNKEFHGCYQFLTSSTIFILEGEFSGNEIILNEYNENGKITGIIKGDMDDNAFYGEWSDIKNIERTPLELFIDSPYSKPCGSLGWIKYVRGNPKGINEITIKKIGEEKSITFDYDNKYYSFDLECSDLDCTQLFAEKNLNDNLISLNISLVKEVFSLFFKSDEITTSISESTSRSLELDCISYADYCNRSDVIVPKSRSPKFNKWVSQKLIPFDKKCGANIKTLDDGTILDRFVTLAHGTIKVDLFNDTLFSGLFVFQSSDASQLIEVPFIYDLGKDKELSLADFYRSNDVLKKSIDSMIIDSRSKSFQDDDQSYFRNAVFDLHTLGDQGIICRNKFNTIYGQKSLVLPYDKIVAEKNPKSRYRLN